MAHVRQRFLDACSNGDVSVLEVLLLEFDIDSNHPQTPYGFDRSIPEEQRPPAVIEMLIASISAQDTSMLSLLFAKFPGTSCNGSTIKAAIDSGNSSVLRAICNFDPAAADAEVGDDETLNALGYACSCKNGAELVEVLLQAGADPNNEPPFKLPSCWIVSAAVIGGLPVETFHQFFDAGYQGNDPRAIMFAVEHNREDVLETLLSRSKTLPYAHFPLEEDLIEVAKKLDNPKMVSAIQNGYSFCRNKEKGFVESFISKLCARKRGQQSRSE